MPLKPAWFDEKIPEHSVQFREFSLIFNNICVYNFNIKMMYVYHLNLMELIDVETWMLEACQEASYNWKYASDSLLNIMHSSNPEHLSIFQNISEHFNNAYMCIIKIIKFLFLIFITEACMIGREGPGTFFTVPRIFFNI